MHFLLDSGNTMANITALYRTSGNSPVVWGFPPGASIVDLVPEDMKAVIHPHWKSFPPVIFQALIIKF